MRRFFLLLLVLLVPGLIRAGEVAQVVLTNQVLALPSLGIIGISEGYEFRLTVNVVDSSGTNAITFSGNEVVQWSIEGGIDGVTNAVSTGQVRNATSGQLLYVRSGLAAGSYRVKAWYDDTDTNTPAAVVAWFPLAVTGSSASSGGGSSTTLVSVAVDASVTSNTFNVTAGDVQADGDVNLLGNIYSWTTNFFAPIFNISITNIIGAVENHINNYVYNTNIVSMVNNIGGVQIFESNTLSFGYAGNTNAPSHIKFFIGGQIVTGSLDGANLNLYGEGGGSGGGISNVVASSPLVSSNINGTVYIGWTTLEGLLVTIPFTNVATIDYTGSTQTFVVGVGYTQMIGQVWGAAAGGGNGGAGGYAEALFTVTNNEILYLVVGRGGQTRTSTTTVAVETDRAFGGGGRGVIKAAGASNGGGGGGFSGIFRADGTPVVVAGGGAGGVLGGSAIPGGGLTGGGVLTSLNGGGGTQDDGGATPPIGANLTFTNSAGSDYQGGDAGFTNGVNNNTAGGGGGGFKGGAGGIQGGSGGAGSGHVSSNCIYGLTIRGVTTTPPYQDSPYYPARTPAVGSPGASTNYAISGNGAIVLRRP